ncbi:33510_t:CDS:2, partial [Racocetra persica]
MLPPPFETYNTADKLFQNTQKFANSQGYALVKKKTWKDMHGELKNMTIHCDQGSVYNNPQAQYNNLWYLKVRNAKYNHSPSEDISGYPI